MKNVVSVALAALVLATGLVCSSAVLSKFFVKVTHEKTIDVKGYAEQDVVSDVGKFTCTYTATDPSLGSAYERLGKARDAVLAHLHAKGFPDASLDVRTIHTTTLNKRDEKGNLLNLIEYYSLSQTIQVTSENVRLIDEAARSVTDLIKEGYMLSATQPDFHVSDLKGIKTKLLAEATADGQQRADILAGNSGGNLGPLASARQGVFQITERNSTETSDYGMYDTSTIDKTVKAVVSLEYEVVSAR